MTKGGRLLSILRSGECFGEMSYIKGGEAPRHATVESMTEVVVAEFTPNADEPGISDIAESHLMRALLNTLVDRLAFADRRILRVVS